MNGSTALPEAPELNSATTVGNVQKVVVGLAPSERMEIAPPAGSRRAEFSAGPELRAKGGDGEPPAGAQITVPGLLVSGGGAAPARPVLVARASPTSPASLAAALRAALPGLPQLPVQPPTEPPPDASFSGRLVYRLAIQMPNVTSYSGSWTIWLAERDAPAGAPHPIDLPVPLHKVDPKYFPSAMDDRVEGKVRLRGVIGADGHVTDIAMIEKLDERLDGSAVDALRRWEFTPASRNGIPVPVDMVVEIPFRLRPEKGQ
jgi:TonB family protein